MKTREEQQPLGESSSPMTIHILSDLHNEFSTFQPEVVDADVVILAGDIDVKSRALEWARSSFSGYVLYVPGNHEYYRGHLHRTLEKMRGKQDERVRVLDRDGVLIGNVRFLGATLWTDYCATGNQPLAAWSAQQSMNDFKHIRTDNYRRLRPTDLIAEHVKSKNWLMGMLEEPHDGPTVVISHHAPTLYSLRENPHAGNELDAAYANRLENLMGGEKVDLWIHGHSHTATDYEIAGTRIVCNPRGYPGEDTGFDPSFIVSL